MENNREVRMETGGFDHLNLSVRDRAETVDWYGRVFGFRVVEEGVWGGDRIEFPPDFSRKETA